MLPPAAEMVPERFTALPPVELRMAAEPALLVSVMASEFVSMPPVESNCSVAPGETNVPAAFVPSAALLEALSVPASTLVAAV